MLHEGFSEAKMIITLILCTHNRYADLRKALESIAVMDLPEFIDWEVLVVDNNSSDRTPSLVEDFCRRYPTRFRYLFEPTAGKSHALNTGIREARGDILAFTDDDVTVDPTWLRNLTMPLHDARWAGTSGRTLPEGDFSPPPWLSLGDRYALAPLGIFDRGSEAHEITESPFGNNMAYRKAIFEKHGTFRNDLGPCVGSKDPHKSEDSEFGVRVLARGERLFYQPSAVLYHSIPEKRLQKKYFQSWWFDKARADIRAFGIPVESKFCFVGIPFHLFRRFAVWGLRWLFAIEPKQRFSAKTKVWALCGSIKECYRIPHDRKGQESAGHANS